MAWKNKVKQLAAQRAHYQRNKAQRIAISRQRQIEIRAYIRKSKEGRACMDCNVVYPHYVMDYDHRDPALKVCNPSFLFQKGWCDARVQQELDKCDLVCANCHRIRTHGQPLLNSISRDSPFKRSDEGAIPSGATTLEG